MWRQLTDDAVKARLSERELETYEHTARAVLDDQGGADVLTIDQRLPQLIDQVVLAFRGNIAANPNISALGPAGTIPDFCIYHAAVLVRHALLGMPPTLEGLTDVRSDEYRAAERFLGDLKTLAGTAFSQADSSAPRSGGDSFFYF